MSNEPNDDLFGDSTMSFGEHLEELRGALFRALGGIAIGFFLGLFLAGSVVEMIKDPLEIALKKFYHEKSVGILNENYDSSAEIENFMLDKKVVFEEIYFERQLAIHLGKGDLPNAMAEPAEQLPAPASDMVKIRIWKPIDSVVKSLNAQEAFMIWIKAALITGAVISSPWVFYQIWMFVAAGLYPHEQRYIHVFLPFSLILFLAGAGLAFFFVFAPVLDFLFGFNKMMNIDPDPRISEWMSFVLFLPVGFGVSFQLPLVMLFLHRIGVFTVESFISQWRIAILVIFIASMLLTPADPISMLMMAVPLTILYFGGIGLCKWMPASRSPFAEPEEM
jgi:sec-independent protein translocase protein TatC